MPVIPAIKGDHENQELCYTEFETSLGYMRPCRMSWGFSGSKRGIRASFHACICLFLVPTHVDFVPSLCVSFSKVSYAATSAFVSPTELWAFGEQRPCNNCLQILRISLLPQDDAWVMTIIIICYIIKDIVVFTFVPKIFCYLWSTTQMSSRVSWPRPKTSSVQQKLNDNNCSHLWCLHVLLYSSPVKDQIEVYFL